MGELIKVLGKFLTRDIFYIESGLLIAVSLLYVTTDIQTQKLDELLAKYGNLSGWILAPLILSLAVALWTMGYLVQETFSILRIATTKPVSNVGAVARFLYRRIQNHEWGNAHTANIDDERRLVLKDPNEDPKLELQRIITLKHAGVTMGSSLVVVAAILFFHGLLRHITESSVIAVISLLLGIILLAVGRVKLLEEMEYIHRFYLNTKHGGSESHTP